MDRPERVGTLIPNSFQVPNVVLDELCPLLEPEELVLVVYVCRRTFGWQQRRDRISMREFVGGSVTASGTVLDRGTGLGESTVRRRLRALIELGVLVLTAAADTQGAGREYALELERGRIDWAALDARRAARDEREGGRGARARAARVAAEASRGVMGEPPPGVMGETPPGVMGETPPGVMGETPPVLWEKPPPVLWEKPPPVLWEKPPPVLWEKPPSI